MQHKKFMDIQRIKEDISGNFEAGDFIYIEEKIDGANASIRYDPKANIVVAQSRKQILSPTNNLRGFYEFTQKLDVNSVKSALGSNLIIFGEFLVPHSVDYPEDKYNKFYVFDVYDTEAEAYLPQKDAINIANQLNLMYVPIFYVGEFVSWEQCMEYVGRTDLGGEFGEGIVIKNQTKLNDPNTRQPFYLKIVAEKFVETKTYKSKKPKSAEELQSRAEAEAIVESIVTDARVTKILHKFIDEGILPEKWGASDMSIVAKNLPKAVYEDCLKEEPEIVKSVVNFGRISGGICMRIARTKI